MSLGDGKSEAHFYHKVIDSMKAASVVSVPRPAQAADVTYVQDQVPGRAAAHWS
jgi:hypothetical protein